MDEDKDNDTYNDCYINSKRESLLKTQELVEVQQLVLEEEGVNEQVQYIDNRDQFNRMTFGNHESE